MDPWRRSSLWHVAVASITLPLLAACDEPTQPEVHTVEGVDFDALFAPPRQAEIDAIIGEWADRDVSAQGVEEVAAASLTVGGVDARLSVVSHTLGAITHYGAILTPSGAQPGSLPVLVYTHGGDGGIDIDETLPLLPHLLEDDLANYVFVAPSFRAEPLVFDGIEYTSDGPPSLWDRDVDDALALVNVVAAITPEADPARIGVLGFSRGACVALLMAERDPRIDVVVEFFGPTDFLGPFVQEVIEEALRSSPRELPGLQYLNDQFIQPLKDGQLTIADVRSELIRRSPVYFAERLPQLMVHHGTEDEIVPVGEAERLIAAVARLDRLTPEFQYFLYEGGTHDPLSLGGSIQRTRDFLDRVLGLASLASAADVAARGLQALRR